MKLRTLIVAFICCVHSFASMHAADTQRSPAEQDEILVRAVMRMPVGFDLSQYPGAAAAVERHITRRAGQKDYLDLVEHFQPDGVEESLVAMMIDPSDDSRSLRVVRYLMRGREGGDRLTGHLTTLPEESAARVARLLGSLGNARSVEILMAVAGDAELPYGRRAAATRGLVKNNLGINAVLDAAEAKTLPGDLRLLAGGLLAKSSDRKTLDRAAKILPLPTTADAAPLPPLDELVAIAGDVHRGRELYNGVATCGKCHIVRGEGKQVGPDLSEIGDKLSRDAMFTSILDPSAGISHNYENHIVLLEDGRILNGILVTQTEEQIVIRNAEAIDLTIDSEEIVEIKKSEVSIMPANLHQTTDQQGLVDLVEYLMTLKKTQPAS